MNKIKRLFCVLLALIVLVTAPGMLPTKVEADAAVGDASLLSLALLFTTWAGITFQQSDNAVTAMQNFLQTKTTAASTLAGLVTKTVLDGAKLFISGDVRTAFRSVLPEIQDFFQVSSNVVSSGGGGQLVSSFVVGVPYSVPIYSSGDIYGFWESNSIPYVSGLSFSLVCHSGTSVTSTPVYSLSSICTHDDIADFVFYLYKRSNGRLIPFLSYTLLSGSGGDFNVLSLGSCDSMEVVFSSSDSVAFTQSKDIDGISVLGSLNSADLDSENKYMNIEGVTSTVSSGLAGSTAAPGLTAEDYERILAEALAGTAVLPTTPEPTAEPTETTPEEDKTQIVTPDILDGMFSGLKGWLESLLASILAAIQAIPEKIDSLWSSITGWWTETIADFKSWIEIKIQSISAWWTDFWADTKIAIQSIGASVSEFFSVTFPAWVTDVKDWAVSLPRTISDAISVALAAAFVPAADYWDAKVAALSAAFPLFNSIVLSADSLRSFFSGLGARPPVIYIDLGSSESWAMGGRTIFLDLTWYSRYKPTMDTVLSAFLWIFALWRIFLHLPSIIRGGSGIWGTGDVAEEKESSTDLTVQ